MKYLFFFFFLVNYVIMYGQPSNDKPKLIIAITIDQMRYDYLYRYYSKYSKFGFKKLLNNGYNCKNTHYHYSSTQTGPGHAHIFNGSVPALSGIVSNTWYDRTSKERMYVAYDSSVVTVGNGSEYSGKMSPKNMIVSSIGDQLKLSNEFQSKVIGIALKDRGAIFPAGHTGIAYWFDSTNGKWITSSYYMKDLPQWVKNFNATYLSDDFIESKWETLLALSNYSESEGDNQLYENPIITKGKTTFPYEIKNYSQLLFTPSGNSLTKDFALRTIKEERLGQHEVPDFISISFSSTDYVGHASGTHSVEIEDTYLRLDKDIGEIITDLENTIGKDNFLIMLTADHGVADIPAFSKKNKIPSGVFWGGGVVKLIDEIVKEQFHSSKWVSMFDNNQVYLNSDSTSKYLGSLNKIFLALKDSLSKQEGVFTVINFHSITENVNLPQPFFEMVKNSINFKRSGDFQIIFEPNWIEGYTMGTTHGSMYPYDTHVPLIWYGWKIKKGNLYRRILISDIAPTLAQILDVLEPNGSIGNPIIEVLDK